MPVEREVYVVAECLDCDWREVGSSLRRDANRLAQLVPKHVRREGHTVNLSRTEVRTYTPDVPDDE